MKMETSIKEPTIKKYVTINEEKNHIHYLVAWKYAYKEARKGEFQKAYLDRLRFKRKIEEMEKNLCSMLDINHRRKIYKERFAK